MQSGSATMTDLEPATAVGSRDWLRRDALRQLAFFRPSLRADGGFDVLDWNGTPLPRTPQELHTTTRLIHSYALGKTIGYGDGDAIIDAGMDYLWRTHRDDDHGGYFWSTDGAGTGDDLKLAYGHVFVLLAGSSARMVGHPDADRLIADASDVLEQQFWDEEHGLLRDEFARDWQPFSTYRGMNANMHGVEALLAAFEATSERVYLDRAGRILDFFTDRMARAHHWRLPEHYGADWRVDPHYSGNPMFRPAGTTPGHSLEMGRLLLQYWDLVGRPTNDAPERARRLIERALEDGWLPGDGLAYTLNHGGGVAIADRYWWPVAEGIAAVASLMKFDARPSDDIWLQRLWQFADDHLVDHTHGGWFPEIDAHGRPTAHQFNGKPDIYHSLQAVLFPLVPGLSRYFTGLDGKGS